MSSGMRSNQSFCTHAILSMLFLLSFSSSNCHWLSPMPRTDPCLPYSVMPACSLTILKVPDGTVFAADADAASDAVAADGAGSAGGASSGGGNGGAGSVAANAFCCFAAFTIAFFNACFLTTFCAALWAFFSAVMFCIFFLFFNAFLACCLAVGFLADGTICCMASSLELLCNVLLISSFCSSVRIFFASALIFLSALFCLSLSLFFLASSVMLASLTASCLRSSKGSWNCPADTHSGSLADCKSMHTCSAVSSLLLPCW